ncbi:hypothetical protein GGR50DRAFT_694864 [Xylaria sp. CBS 124048]|nr:hypothetical protein GGR50DRAFT_694864 [Xylaria sp. CBS 124048]
MAERTENSMVHGKRARNTYFATRLSWTDDELLCFQVHLQAHPVEEEIYEDLNDLLRQLDLDGYDGIQNTKQQDVGEIIADKVKAKLASMYTPGLYAKCGPGNEFISEYTIKVIFDHVVGVCKRWVSVI